MNALLPFRPLILRQLDCIRFCAMAWTLLPLKKNPTLKQLPANMLDSCAWPACIER